MPLLRTLAILGLTLALAVAPARAEAPDGEPEPDPQRGRVLLPFLFYTPETSLAGGASAIWYLRGDWAGPDDVPSVVSTWGTYTARSQVILQAHPELFIAGGRYLVGGDLQFRDFPDRYWGIGPATPEEAEEDYTLLARHLLVYLERQFSGPWRARVLGMVESSRLKEFEEGGLLDGTGPRSELAGRVAGLGLGAAYDSRDDRFAPRSGSWHRADALWFREGLGGDFHFSVVEIDLRTFRPLGQAVLGLQGVVRAVGGEPPFYHLSELGGPMMLRGVFGGRYRDKHKVAAQAEWRRPLRGRWGIVAFAAAGAVAPGVGDFDLRDTQLAAGLGARFRLAPDEQINARLDVALGDEGINVYISLMEAF